MITDTLDTKRHRLIRARAETASLRAKLSLSKKKKAAHRRKAVVAWAKWGVAHEPQIHYREIRPFPLSPRLPFITDCSGFATFCYFHACAPDPNGFDYDGAGYTGTLLKHGRKINAMDCLPGDLIVYGDPASGGHHVVIAIEAGPDPLCVSHGQERGPALIKHSVEKMYQPKGITFLRFPMI